MINYLYDQAIAEATLVDETNKLRDAGPIKQEHKVGNLEFHKESMYQAYGFDYDEDGDVLDEEFEICDICDGEGLVYPTDELDFAEECLECEGTGYVPKY